MFVVKELKVGVVPDECLQGQLILLSSWSQLEEKLAQSGLQLAYSERI